MTDAIDRTLADDHPVAPAPGFAARVMRRILGTPAPPPLAFPLKRFAVAAATLAVCAFAIAWLGTDLLGRMHSANNVHLVSDTVLTLFAAGVGSVGALWLLVRTPG